MAKLVRALSAMQPTYSDRVRVRASLLAALPTAKPGVAVGLVAELSALADPTADPWAVARLAAALPTLDPTDAERARACDSLSDALSTEDSLTLERLVRAMRSLGHPDEWLSWLNDGA